MQLEVSANLLKKYSEPQDVFSEGGNIVEERKLSELGDVLIEQDKAKALLS